MSDPGDVTQLLKSWSNGRREALNQLVPLVYAELRRLSRHYLRGRGANDTMQTGDLINEAFVRLIDRNGINWQNRAHFFGVAARTMRNILVDRARQRQRKKRGGGETTVPYDDLVEAPNQRRDREILGLDEALESLHAIDPGLSRLVELRYFGGLSIDETAEALEVSPATIKRGWKTAQLWLRRECTRS